MVFLWTLAVAPWLPEARADPEQDAANLRRFQENSTKIMALVDDHEPLTPLEGSLIAVLPIDGEPSLSADCIAAGLKAADLKEGGWRDAERAAAGFAGCLRGWLSRAARKYGTPAQGRGENFESKQRALSAFDSKFVPEYMVRLDLKLYRKVDGPLWPAYSAEAGSARMAMPPEERAKKWRTFVEMELLLYKDLQEVPQHEGMVPQIKDPVESLKKAEERVRMVLDLESADKAALAGLAEKMQKNFWSVPWIDRSRRPIRGAVGGEVVRPGALETEGTGSKVDSKGEEASGKKPAPSLDEAIGKLFKDSDSLEKAVMKLVAAAVPEAAQTLIAAAEGTVEDKAALVLAARQEIATVIAQVLADENLELAEKLAPSLLKDYYCRGLVTAAALGAGHDALAELKALQTKLGVAVEAPAEEAAALAAIDGHPAQAVQSCLEWLRAKKKTAASEDKPGRGQAGLVVQDVPEPAGRPVDDEQAPRDREKPSSGGKGGLDQEKVKDGALGAALGGGLFGIAALFFLGLGPVGILGFIIIGAIIGFAAGAFL